MTNQQNNYAFIDSQNLNLSIRELGWKLDFASFRRYLTEKYNITQAYLFIGYIEGNNSLYASLQAAGYICIFKPTLKYRDGTTKGNCDAELVLHTMIEFSHFDQAIIVSGDGDFYCLVDYLLKQGKLKVLMIPNRNKYSALLKFRVFRPFLRFLNEQKEKLATKKEKAP